MRKAIIGLFAALLFVPAMAHAQTSIGDICAEHQKLTAQADISTATDTQLVPLIANRSILVCSYTYDGAVGAGTLYLESATAASCGGTLAQVGNLMTSNTSNPEAHFTSSAEPGTKIAVANGDALCAHSTGTIHQDIQVTYVIQ